MQCRQQARGRPEARGRLERGREGNLGLLSREHPQGLLAVTVGAGGEGSGLQVSGIMEQPLSEMENTEGRSGRLGRRSKAKAFSQRKTKAADATTIL